MKKVKSGVQRRAGAEKARGEWKLVGKFLTHLLGGGVMLFSLVAVEAVLILALRWITTVVGASWFTGAVEALDGLLFLIDAGLLVWWVIKSIQQVRKEISDE